MVAACDAQSMCTVPSSSLFPVIHVFMALPQMRALRERMREVAAAHEAQKSAVLARYAALRAEVAAYHRRLDAAMAAGTTRALAALDINAVPSAPHSGPHSGPASKQAAANKQAVAVCV